MIKAEQLPAVDLEELVAAVKAAVLADGAVGQHRPDVVVRVLLFAVDLLDGPLQADAQTAILKKDQSQSLEKRFLKLKTGNVRVEEKELAHAHRVCIIVWVSLWLMNLGSRISPTPTRPRGQYI